LQFLLLSSQALLYGETSLRRFRRRSEPENPMTSPPPKRKRKPPGKAKALRFDSLVARYYPAVYSVASQFTDNHRAAVALTREAFKSTQRQLQTRRDEYALATIFMSAVIRAGVATA
jgi:hypothetical protein